MKPIWIYIFDWSVSKENWDILRNVHVRVSGHETKIRSSHHCTGLGFSDLVWKCLKGIDFFEPQTGMATPVDTLAAAFGISSVGK